MNRIAVGAPDTRRRVLGAEGEVFAEHGFEKARVREIVERAGADSNAVDYCFGDKRALYHALFEHAHQVVVAGDHEAFARARALSPVGRLHAIVALILRGFILPRRASWQVRLILRELFEPTGVLGAMVNRFIRSRFAEVCEVVRAPAPRGASDVTIRCCAESVLALCAHIAHRRVGVARVIRELTYDAAGIDVMARHVTRFSLAAVRHLPDEESVQ